MNEYNCFRDRDLVDALAQRIRQRISRKWVIMEMCGGQTNAIARFRLEDLLPQDLELVHGPGCPVCVTPQTIIDQAIELAQEPDVIFASFGDMVRVPGVNDSLLSVRSKGADVRIVYSPLDAVRLAKENPDKQIVFFAIGFETTLPVYALALKNAIHANLNNFSLLTSLVTVPAAVASLMEDPENRVQGLLAAGHVCAVTGLEEYEKLAHCYHLPICVTGFEPADILWGIYNCVDQLEKGENSVRNNYSRIVNPQGNIKALEACNLYFEPIDQEWRGMGIISQSGLKIRKEYEHYDAFVRYKITQKRSCYTEICLAGDIMKGKIQPTDCPLFGQKCTPDQPLGASMVSSEGACAAYYKYKRNENKAMSITL